MAGVQPVVLKLNKLVAKCGKGFEDMTAASDNTARIFRDLEREMGEWSLEMVEFDLWFSMQDAEMRLAVVMQDDPFKWWMESREKPK